MARRYISVHRAKFTDDPDTEKRCVLRHVASVFLSDEHVCVCVCNLCVYVCCFLFDLDDKDVVFKEDSAAVVSGRVFAVFPRAALRQAHRRPQQQNVS